MEAWNSREWLLIKSKLMEMEKRASDALVSTKTWEETMRTQEKVKVIKTILMWETKETDAAE